MEVRPAFGCATGLRIGFTCGSETFFKQIAERVRELTGIPAPKIHAYPPPQVAWQMNYYGTNALLVADRLYDGAGDLFMARKRQKIEDYRARRTVIQQPEWAVVSDATKRCSRCRATKPAAEFCRNRRNQDGRSDYCRACARLQHVEAGRVLGTR